MAVCDVFTCGETAEPEKAVEYMKEQLKATDIISEQFERPLEWKNYFNGRRKWNPNFS